MRWLLRRLALRPPSSPPRVSGTNVAIAAAAAVGSSRSFRARSMNAQLRRRTTSIDLQEFGIFGSQDKRKAKYALLILNHSVSNPSRLRRLWNGAAFRVTVDGGTNHWHAVAAAAAEGEIRDPEPDLITGDFDSVKSDVLEYYRQKGCRIKATPDQDCTDFTKALKEISHMRNHEEYSAVLAFCDNGGRLDQIMANLETLYNARSILPNLPVLLVASTSVSWLLDPGRHAICIPSALRRGSGVNVGLIPLGAPVEKVTTIGLKWNLSGEALAFGQLVSTSNAIEVPDGHDAVCVETSGYLIWTMEINE